MTTPSLLGPLAAFALIVALIPTALWLLKRSRLGPFQGSGGTGPVRLVAALPLSANQRIVTVEVGAGDARRWLVLGVTPAGIHTLHSLPPQAESGPPLAGPLPLFAKVLSRYQASSAATATPTPTATATAAATPAATTAAGGSDAG